MPRPGSPVQLSHDPVGYDASVTPYDGGLFLQAEAFAASGVKGLLLPYCSTLLETAVDGNGALSPVGACRVGTSWLPPAPPAVTLTLVPAAGSVSVTLTASGQGDGTAQDIYLSCSVITLQSGVTIDPGVTGLPYRRLSYLLSSYLSWDALWDAIDQDGETGQHPLRVTARTYSDPSLGGSAPALVADPSQTSWPLTYGASPAVTPDTSLASTWASIFESEDLPLDEAPFLCLAGLSGQALAADPTSAARLLTVLDGNAYEDEENPDLTLVVPWSVTAPTTLDVDGDVAALGVLVQFLGQDLASRLIVVWGTGAQDGLPLDADLNVRVVPAAYMAIGAFMREASVTDNNNGQENLLHPEVRTALQTGVPIALIQAASQPPAPTVPTSLPSPAQLDALLQAGMIAITRSVGDRWCLHGPPCDSLGQPIMERLVRIFLRDRCQAALTPFLGRDTSPNTLKAISQTVQGLSAAIAGGADPISAQIASLTLTIVGPVAGTMPSITTLQLEGSLRLYGEVNTVAFQVNLGT